MGIFRGIGGTGNSTDDGVVDAVTAQAVIATNKATEAATSATSAYNSAQSASTSKDTATTQANAAQSSANTASTHATNASTSATSAATSATSATASATTATTKASEAATSATNAATSETNAATSATTASTKASEAATSATTATTKAGEASTSATNAASSATSASTSASTATTKASEASTSAASAASSYDSFDDRYLGAKSSAPSVDNDGDALITGALYFDTTSDSMKVYSGSSWLDAYASLSGALIATNNLSDLNNVSTARTNLGLGTAATTDASAYATAAQADQTVSLTGAGATSISGTYPNFTITSTDTNTTYSVGDGGLTEINFTSADNTKLDGIEASADVTDTANVTAAGALMDSELTSEASVKALNQGVATTDSPTFGGVTATGQGVFKVDSTDQIKIGDSSLTNFWTLRAGTNLLFKDNGTERMRIDSSGRVGIGTTTPSRMLHLKGAVPALRLEDTDVSGLYHELLGALNTGYIIAVDEGNVASGSFFRVDIDGSEKFRIDSSGRVGIGTSSPQGTVHISAGTSGDATLILEADTDNNLETDNPYMVFEQDGGVQVSAIGHMGQASTDENALQIANSVSSGGIEFLTGTGSGYTNAGSAMKIDTSGNVLVGTTSTTLYSSGAGGDTGILLDPNGPTSFARSSAIVSYFNRLDTQGDIIALRKEGSTVGSFGTVGSDLYIVNGDTGLRFNDAVDSIYPVQSSGTSRDNAIDLGFSSIRFDDIYATNGTIQTSDRNEKQDIAELSEAEQRVAVAAKGLLRKFRWKDKVVDKGNEARIHFGIIAQDLQSAFAAEGLDASDYGMFISTTWTDEETNEEKTRMGVRYSELLAFIISAI